MCRLVFEATILFCSLSGGWGKRECVWPFGNGARTREMEGKAEMRGKLVYPTAKRNKRKGGRG